METISFNSVQKSHTEIILYRGIQLPLLKSASIGIACDNCHFPQGKDKDGNPFPPQCTKKCVKYIR